MRLESVYFSPVCLLVSSVLMTDVPTKVDSTKHLGTTNDRKLRWSSHISNCVKKLRRLSFHIKRLRHFQVKQNAIFLSGCLLSSIVRLSFLLVYQMKTPESFSGVYYQQCKFHTTARTIHQIVRYASFCMWKIWTENSYGYVLSAIQWFFLISLSTQDTVYLGLNNLPHKYLMISRLFFTLREFLPIFEWNAGT